MDEKNQHIDYAEFDAYLRQQEPSKRETAANWKTAIGLQDVDRLRPSRYLIDVAKRNIEGEITIDESRQLVRSYYQSKAATAVGDDGTEEADLVASNIAKILSSRSFALTANGYISLHRRIFEGVFKHAGHIRHYDITKKEWVLGGDTVHYLNWEDLRRALDYDIEQERAFRYQGLAMGDIVEHIARFISGIWQIHAFEEGNTRTTAVFAILYLRSMGFDVDNDMFAHHSWYFRNALVRANYRNVRQGIEYSPVYLVRFFRNLLMGDAWDLKNRYLHIHPRAEWQRQVNRRETADDTVNDTVNDTVKLRLREVLDIIQHRPGLNSTRIAVIIGKSIPTAKRYLNTLVKQGKIEFRGAQKTGGYYLTPKE